MRLTREQIQSDSPAGHPHPGPVDYDYLRHIASLAASSVGVAALSLRQLKGVGLKHWAVLAGTLLLANAGEYGLHRGPFHHRYPPLWRFARGLVGDPASSLYTRHTTMHHAMFTEQRMDCDGPEDLRWILLPAWGFAAVILAMSPVALALYKIDRNATWMFLLGLAVYYIVYELLHTAAHLPASHPATRSRIIQAVTHHHRVHHDPRLMRRFNFNFAFPIFDVLFDTLYRAERDKSDAGAAAE